MESVPTVSESVTSPVDVYLPGEALQGESLPSFILWRGETVQRIDIQFPDALQVSDVYNVASGEWSVQHDRLTVNRVEVDGYLGVLFSSRRLDTTSRVIDVRFELHRGDRIESWARRVHLYRPLLKVRYCPAKITMDVSKGRVDQTIQIVNEGLGTVFVSIVEDKGSEVELREPEALAKFQQLVREDIEIAFANFAKDFPDYSELMKDLATLIVKQVDMGDPEAISKAKTVISDFSRATEVDKDLLPAVVQAIAGAFVKNFHMFNVYEQIAEYVKSIGASKILVRNPLDLISVAKASTTLKLKVEYTDLTFEYFEPLHLTTSIASSGNTEGELSVYRVLEWGEPTS